MSDFLLLTISIFLYLGKFDVNVWIVGVTVLLGLLIAFIYFSISLKRMQRFDSNELYIANDNVQFDMILKAMKLAVWSIDVKTHIISYGDDYREYVDNFIPIEGTKFDNTIDIIHPEDADRVYSSLISICAGTSDSYHEQYRVIIPKTGGKYYWTESYGTVSERENNGSPSKIVGATMRVDDRKDLENALVVEKNKAEESNRLKSLFIANINHEIRTPLNSMSGYAQVLLNYDITEDERKNCLERIVTSSDILASLLNTMMEFSNTEAGRNIIHKESIDVNLLINGLVENFSHSNKKKRVSILSNIPDEKVIINSDRNAIKSICEHLMENALKFTSVGSVTLGYKLLDNNFIRIWVEDTGCGISNDDKTRIFDSFVKLDEFVQGAGLGLSMCKNIVYNLDGNIGVDSAVGLGSLFWFEIPVN